MQVLLHFILHIQNWGTRSLYNLPKVTKLKSLGEGGGSIQAFCTSKLTYFTIPKSMIQKNTRRQEAIILLIRNIKDYSIREHKIRYL